MQSRFTPLIALLFSLLPFSAVYSQTDSTHFDLGRLRVNRALTQTITIKAADLQRQPFTNIADAINVWFNGTYTNNNNLVYVVDGNLLNDVNAYNIYDIAEITLVQNSLAQLNGAATQQQMVLITTKRNYRGKSGIIASGQTNLVTLKNSTNVPDAKSTTNLFNQYYISGYQNTDNISAGLSASYLRDVVPFLKSNTINAAEPMNLNRFKFNGYTDIKLGSSNTLNLSASYVPQVNRFNYTNNDLYNDPNYAVQTDLKYHNTQNLLNAGLQLNSQLATGLNNKVSFSYNRYQYHNYQLSSTLGTNAGVIGSYATDTSFYHQSTLLIDDNLSYQKKLGKFSIEPAIDFNYRHLSDSIDTRSFAYRQTNQDPQNPVYTATSTSRSWAAYKLKSYLLTPSLSISYLNSINIQGGFLIILNSHKGINFDYAPDAKKRFYPFVSTGIDVAKLAGLNNLGIKLFGSFSRQNSISQTTALGLSNITSSDVTNLMAGTSTNDLSNAYPNLDYNPYKPLNTYNAGVVIDLLPSITLTYNFLNTHHLLPVTYYFDAPPNGTQQELLLPDVKLTSDRIGLTFHVIDKTELHFTSGINATNIKQQMAIFNKDVTIGNKMWTGGWINRLDYNRIFAGLDVLYQTGEPGILDGYAIYTPLATGRNAHSFSLQNIYFGYRIITTQLKSLEVFANARNLWQNNISDITDNRVYYGLGFKLGL